MEAEEEVSLSGTGHSDDDVSKVVLGFSRPM